MGSLNSKINIIEELVVLAIAEEKQRFKALDKNTQTNHLAVIHDIATPLTTALLNCELLKRERNDPGIENIYQAIYDMYSILKTQQCVDGVFEVNEILIQLLTENRILLENENIICTVTSQDVCYIKGDPLPLKRILRNLLTNAVDSLRETTKVTKNINIGLVTTKEYCYITIEDNGIGIATEQLAHIFTAHYSTKNCSENLGMGLYICKQLITTKFSGTVSVTSTKGQGAKFALKIPIAQC